MISLVNSCPCSRGEREGEEEEEQKEEEEEEEEKKERGGCCEYKRGPWKQLVVATLPAFE